MVIVLYCNIYIYIYICDLSNQHKTHGMSWFHKNVSYWFIMNLTAVSVSQRTFYVNLCIIYPLQLSYMVLEVNIPLFAFILLLTIEVTEYVFGIIRS